MSAGEEERGKFRRGPGFPKLAFGETLLTQVEEQRCPTPVASGKV